MEGCVRDRVSELLELSCPSERFESSHVASEKLSSDLKEQPTCKEKSDKAPWIIIPRGVTTCGVHGKATGKSEAQLQDQGLS